MKLLVTQSVMQAIDAGYRLSVVSHLRAGKGTVVKIGAASRIAAGCDWKYNNGCIAFEAKVPLVRGCALVSIKVGV